MDAMFFFATRVALVRFTDAFGREGFVLIFARPRGHVLAAQGGVIQRALEGHRFRRVHRSFIKLEFNELYRARQKIGP